ncbi:MAG: acetyl-CoA carboxylase, carboxyltransferase subunit beta [Candidatus Omnitrophica bacterium]|nr:acetyl-CoA carboxylase, carboxyltransferase subunit beta [Candidatus Omnitrophota bacterium]MBU4346555.1 acetyl-CoA carboxylase, carboxyltransferase subunit beta [Candidatus Omnitrophota bacterium]MBU4472970.1 acetyl-CoA carboxylase, carboxyltransferase subunit beta [Candidatus Omnitrophota bacterium]MCG2707000.1 acetyl-CoA carboxylase, carboxyltransferase subunit beta [Candidatus Omnitrophota bacterium]
MALFGKPKYTIVRLKKKEIPDGLWTKCDGCSEVLYNKTLEENLRVCPKCNHYFTLGAYERINMLLDKDTFQEYDKDMISSDPLGFKGPKTYIDKLLQEQQATGLKEAVVTGEGLLDNKGIVIAVTDSRFIMGSMGSVVGEKITRATEAATKNKLPLIIVSGSGGGARMYEGMFSLMQMAKTSAALSLHHQKKLLFISVLTNPTMAGVMASFAGLGDIIIAEPKALIGFTGPRVIEQTIRQKLPPGFQRSEFLLEHGLIDKIVHRNNLKTTLSQLLDYLS